MAKLILRQKRPTQKAAQPLFECHTVLRKTVERDVIETADIKQRLQIGPGEPNS